MLHDLQRIFSGINARQEIQERHPDIMADHDDDDYFQENRKLLSNRPFVSKAAECAGNEERQDRDDDAAHDLEHDLLEFIQQLRGAGRSGPGDSQPDQDREHQSAHHAHDRRDLQLEDSFRKRAKPLGSGNDGKPRNQCIASCCREKGSSDRGSVCKKQSNAQHAGSVFSKSGDGRRDKPDNDKRHAKIDDLTQNLF